MIKRTIYIGNPVYLYVSEDQLCLDYSKILKGEAEQKRYSIPIEDIGVLMLDERQVTLTVPLLQRLLENNVAIIVCSDNHHPQGMFLNLDGHTKQSERFKYQIDASQPLKKQLWQQTIKKKIQNQARLLSLNSVDVENMDYWEKSVRSGDPTGVEAKAAAYYWKHLFKEKFPLFTRRRDGEAPNHLLNYAYSLVRATVARALTGSGLLPTLGIFHRNQYNAFCLADDIMEPYRPFADASVLELVKSGAGTSELTRSIKQHLLELLVMDVMIDGQRSPLMVAIGRTTASLAKCYTGESNSLIYPSFRTD